MGKKTYHSKIGRFCSADSASLVVKDGQKFKVVRQHRRFGAKPSEEQQKTLPSARWIPISEVLEAFGVSRVR